MKKEMLKVSKITMFCLLVICLIATVASAALLLDEPLQGSTTGVRSGGQFVTGGWKVTGTTDSIYWHIPSTSKGVAEWDIKGLNPNECRTGMEDKADLFHMYDYTYGNSDTVYSGGYRENPYKHFVRKTGCLGSYNNTIDSMELLLQIGTNYVEPDTPVISWNSNTNYHFREEWGPDGYGNCVFKLYRDGVLLKTWSVPGNYTPVGHSVRIAASTRRDPAAGAPIDAIFSNIKVWNTTGPPTKPTVVSPANNSTVKTTTPFIKWNGDLHTKYHVHVCTANDPDTGIVWDSGEVTSSRDYVYCGTLPNLTDYYVFVQLANDNGWSPWSDAGYKFRVDTNYNPANSNIVSVQGSSLADNDGAFLGLGVTYMPAMRRCKYDRNRFINELDYLAARGFKFVRILSMVGWYTAWQGKEIAPVSYNNQGGVYVPAWPDYWQQFRDCIDLIYTHGMRAELTIFADAQLMPNKTDRINHMASIISNLAGREHKIAYLEVCNEAWQNGFSGSQGVADLREFGQYLSDRTSIPVALSAPEDSGAVPSIQELYSGSAADITTLHLSRNIGTSEGGWLPVRDSWDFANISGCPPASSNEPIGPGASVNVENDPIKLVSAAVFAWIANCPIYVYHTGAGVGIQDIQFSDMAGIGNFAYLEDILPGDISSWVRNDGKEASAPFTAYCSGQANKYWTEVGGATSGCHRNIGAIKGGEFISYPQGILGGGLQLTARRPVKFKVYNPLTGAVVDDRTMNANEQFTLSAGPGAYIIKGIFTDVPTYNPEKTLNVKLATGAITIDGNSSDWNLSEFTTPIRGGQAGSGDYALVGYDAGSLYYGARASDVALPTNAADHTAKVYSRHDSTYQYFLVRCDDDDMRYNNAVDMNWANDCVEFYIDPSHNGGTSTISNSSSDIQLVIDANNQKNVYCTTSAYAVQVLNGVMSVVARDATGWTLEVRIAKSAINPALPVAGTLGLDFNFRDNDNNNDSTKTTVYTWSDNYTGGGFPSKIPDKWGNAFLNGTDIAQYISNTIPATMEAGQSYNVTVTMKNTGTNTWTSDAGYGLGAVGDSDPLCALGRIALANADSIAIDQQKTFALTMIAPNTVGTYTTDWRMVHEGVMWFGDTLTKQVQVTNVQAPAQVANFKATSGNAQNVLSWTNPSDLDFTGTMIRYSTTGYPSSITDGTLVINKTNTPGSSDTYTHNGLTNGLTYYYSAFTYDGVPNYSGAAQVNAVPAVPVTIANSVFNMSVDNWNIVVWRVDPTLSYATMVWSNSAGNPGGGIRCTGIGDTDGAGCTTREGGEMYKTISTVGYKNIKVSYDLRVSSLGGNYVGAGSCGVDHGLIDEQLTAFYSTDGGSSWTEAEYLTRNSLLGYQTYGTRTIDLSGISGVNNKSTFALKFRWQVNSPLDLMDLDNIKVIGQTLTPPDVTGPVPTIGAASVGYTKSGPVTYTVNFNESATGFNSSGDIQLNKTGTAAVGSTTVTGSGTGPYTVTLSQISGDGTIGITVKASSCTDAAGNGNSASSPSSKVVVLASDGSIAAAKGLANDAPVYLGNKALYMKSGSYGYIEEQNRVSGLRIEGTLPVSADQLVWLVGTMKTSVNGERYIQIDSIANSAAYVLKPFGMNNQNLADRRVDGLYVTAWGKVKAGSITSNSFVMSDGFNGTGIKVVTSGAPGVNENAYVTILGAAGYDGTRVIYKK